MTLITSGSQPLVSLPLDHNIPICSNLGLGIGHALFFITNEHGQEATLNKLKKLPIEENRNTLLGVSGFYLLNVAAVRGEDFPQVNLQGRQIEHVVITDCSLIVEHFWEKITEVMCNPIDRKLVCEKIRNIISENALIYFPANYSQEPFDLDEAVSDQLRGLNLEILSGVSWLSSDAKFSRIAKIFQEKKFHFIRLDLADTESVATLIENMKLNDMNLDTVYLSNVHAHSILKNFEGGFLRTKDLLCRFTANIIEADSWSLEQSLSSFTRADSGTTIIASQENEKNPTPSCLVEAPPEEERAETVPTQRDEADILSVPDNSSAPTLGVHLKATALMAVSYIAFNLLKYAQYTSWR